MLSWRTVVAQMLDNASWTVFTVFLVSVVHLLLDVLAIKSDVECVRCHLCGVLLSLCVCDER